MKREGMDKLEKRFVRWKLGIDARTPGYMVREKLQREKLRERAQSRVWKFERSLEMGGGSKWARKCLEEVKSKEKERSGDSEWERKRRDFLRKEVIKREK